MKNIMKSPITWFVLGLFFLQPTPSYAWHGGHSRFSLDLSIPMGGYYRVYDEPVSVSTYPSVYEPVPYNGTTYYVYNGQYYVYTTYGYQLVSPPVTIVPSASAVETPQVQETAIENADRQTSFTVNIPSSQGGYIPVVIKRSGNGFIGPQGEFYKGFPRVSQLEVMYGK